MTPTQRLRRALHEEQAHRAAVEAGIRELLAHLSSAKFVDVEQDGERRDWIATRDVDRDLLVTLQEGLQARDVETRYRWAVLTAADCVGQLRAADLDRVLEPFPEMNLPGFVAWLIASRPDLTDRIREVEEELDRRRSASVPNAKRREIA